jgi:hypothetical protein
MSVQEAEASPAAAPEKTEETLRRILAALEHKPRRGWVEVACAVVLALATMSSAWCAYQSKLWGNAQGSRGGAAAEEAKKASENRLLAGEIRAVESMVFVKFVEAKFEGNGPLAAFYTSRLRPTTQAALEAWWATKPRENSAAPRSPFQMSQYRQPEVAEAMAQEEHAVELGAAAAAAGRNSDTYVLLTVLFASVLFFGGISGTFESLRLRRVVLAISVGLFLVTFTTLATMPISWK